MTDYTVYFDAGWDIDNTDLLADYRKLTPDQSGTWGNISATSDPDDAEFHVALNEPSVSDPSGRLLLFCMEPPCLSACTGWDRFDSWRAFPVSDTYFPQKWTVGPNYDDLTEMDPPEKTADLSWITTDKGRHMSSWEAPIRRLLLATGIRKHSRKEISALNHPTDGHILRMQFFERLVEDHGDLLNLYGRGDFSGSYYHGAIEDKWDGLAPYRYSLAIENYRGPNYWSEKIADALLAWCMPIYWGCTNLEEYLPAESFVRIDIESPDAPDRVREIVESDRRQKHLDAIAEARRRILEEYQIWPTVEKAVTGSPLS